MTTGISLALDLGSNRTGWALGKAQRLLMSGSWDLSGSRFDDYAMRGVRLQSHLTGLAVHYNPAIVVFERVEFRGKNSSVNETQLYGLTYGAMVLWCKNRLIPFYGITPGEWKKAAIGNGNAGKPLIKSTIESRIGREIEEQDEADAIGILFYHLLSSLNPSR